MHFLAEIDSSIQRTHRDRRRRRRRIEAQLFGGGSGLPVGIWLKSRSVPSRQPAVMKQSQRTVRSLIEAASVRLSPVVKPSASNQDKRVLVARQIARPTTSRSAPRHPVHGRVSKRRSKRGSKRNTGRQAPCLLEYWRSGRDSNPRPPA